MCLGTSFEITFNFPFHTEFRLWRASSQHGTTLAEPSPVEAVSFSQTFFISTLLPWLETAWASKSMCLSVCTQGFAWTTKRVLGCGASSTPPTDVVSWFCCQTFLWWPWKCWGMGQWDLAWKGYNQWSSYHPQGCPQDSSSSLCLGCSCSSCWATLWFAAQDAKLTPPISSVNYDDLTVMAWNGWTSSVVRVEGELGSFKGGTRPSILIASIWDIDT